jgi:hypothetical protein
MTRRRKDEVGGADYYLCHRVRIVGRIALSEKGSHRVMIGASGTDWFVIHLP